jgi:hypothetical protein
MSTAQRTPNAHIALHRKFLEVANYLLPTGDQAKPILWHWGTHPGNIFVHEGRVCGLLDWQDTWTGPLFCQARRPAFVKYNGELMLRLPEGFQSLEDEDEKLRLRVQVERSLLLSKYDTETKGTNPVLHNSMDIAQEQNRRHILGWSSNTWDGDIMPFRQCLIRVARHVHSIPPAKFISIANTYGL